MSERYAFVIMIKEKWWNEFCRLNRAGKTMHAYVRRGPAPPKNAKLIFFYVIKPVGEIQGYAEFQERIVGEADAMWKEYGRESCVESENQYYDLLKGKKKVTFIRFKNMHEAVKPVSSNDILTSLGTKRTPRRGFYINEEVAGTLIKLME
jgi:predicted transcriptional regulator